MESKTVQTPIRPRRWLRALGLLFLLFVLFIGIVMIDMWSAFGSQPTGQRLERIQQSPQYVNGRFDNPLPEQSTGEFGKILIKFLFADKSNREPKEPLPVIQRSAAEFAVPASDLRVTWLGHSTLLIEIDGRRFLIDPVFGDYASPNKIMGIKRFYAPPLALEDLPEIDAVVLSHDHYDHLNEASIKKLADRIPRFVVPLGLGAHLESWGVAPERITELDWWDMIEIGGVEVVCTPARHFSGRSLTGRNTTLWAGWALIGENRRVFFSGDTAMFPRFEEIGRRYGPFDLTMLEVGAYNTAWMDVHMGPEQAVQAHQMLQGKRMMPVHWATFNLAFHGWTEPIERLLVAAEEAGIQLVVPRPGQSIDPDIPPTVSKWWPDLPWETAEQTPILSSGMEAVFSE